MLKIKTLIILFLFPVAVFAYEPNAKQIKFDPSGSIESTTADGAIKELDNEKLSSFEETDPTVDTSAEIQAIIGSGVYAPALGADDNYVTDAEKTVIGNTSGTNTGDETQSTIKTKLGVASSGVDGYLSGMDWNTFNNKQPAGAYITVETDPVFTAWDKSTGISITESQISDLQSYLTAESDPVFTAWDKSTGISITESQISDFGSYLTSESDPNAWLISTGQTLLTGDKSGSFNLLTTGTLGAGAITATSFTIGANTLTTAEFAFLDGQDQEFKTTSSPTFVGLDLTGLTDGYVPYVGVGALANSPIYTDGTNVGIGINPAVRLHLAKSVATDFESLRLENLSTASNITKTVSLTFHGRDTADGDKEVGKITLVPSTINWLASDMVFGTQSGAYTTSERLRITGVGDIVIKDDNQKLRFGTGQDTYIAYTGTYWDFDIAQATTAIRINPSLYDTDFIVYGDTGAIMTLDAGTLGATFGGAITGTSITDSGLTSGRVPYASTGGLLADDNNLTYTTDSLGVEKLTNGTFTGSTTGWSVGSGWVYNTNLVRKQTDGTAVLSQSSTSMVTPLAIGQEYRLEFTISSWTVGSVTASCGGATLTQRTGNGTYTEDFIVTSTAALAFTPTNTARFYIDTVSLKRITSTLTTDTVSAYDVTGKTSHFGSVLTAQVSNLVAGQFYASSNYPNTLTDPLCALFSGTSQAPMAFSCNGTIVGYAKGDSAGNLAFGANALVVFESGGFGAANETARFTENNNVLIGKTTESGGSARLEVNGKTEITGDLELFGSVALADAPGIWCYENGAGSYMTNDTVAQSVYAYKTIDGSLYYSVAGGVLNAGPMSTDSVGVYNEWTAVAGAEGYVINRSYNGGAADGRDVGNVTTFQDDGSGWGSAINVSNNLVPASILMGGSLTNGKFRFNGDSWYGTITTGSAEKGFILDDGTRLTSGRIPIATTNGRLTDDADMTYSGTRLSPNYITLAAGTATTGTSPLKFTTGTDLTVAEAGAVEYSTGLLKLRADDFGLIADSKYIYQGAGSDVKIGYTGTYWDFDIAQATTAIRINPSLYDTDFIVYGDTGAIMTLDAGTLGATFGGAITSSGTFDVTGAVGLVLGSADVTSFTITTDGTGNAEFTLPNDVIGDADIDWGAGAGQVSGADITFAEGDMTDSTIVSADIKDGTIVGGDLVSTIAITSTGVQDYGGATSFKIPNGANPTLSAAGQIAINTTDKTLELHNGTAQIAIPTIKIAQGTFDLKAQYAVDSDLWLIDLHADSYPHGIYITKVYVDATVADPTTELNANLMYCDAVADGAFPGANATLIKAIDTTTGNFADAAVNTAIATGKTIYIDMDVDPVDLNTMYHIRIHYYIPTS